MTFLVFPATATWTGIVSSDLRLVTTNSFDLCVVTTHTLWLSRPISGAGQGGSRPSGGPERRGRRSLGAAAQNQRWARAPHRTRLRWRFVADHRSQPPQIANDLLVHPILHRLEQFKAFL